MKPAIKKKRMSPSAKEEIIELIVVDILAVLKGKVISRNENRKSKSWTIPGALPLCHKQDKVLDNLHISIFTIIKILKPWKR